jgi:hypothetical protein
LRVLESRAARGHDGSAAIGSPTGTESGMSERITLKSAELTAEFLPAQGGRLSSLRPAKSDFDFFAPRAWSGEAAEGRAAAPFGAEDLFPLKRGGRYPAAPYDRIEIPDLGDARVRAWRHERRGGAVRMWTADKRFGYKLEKRISFPSPSVLRFDYRLDNVADEALLFVWFGRLALPLHRGVRLALPARVWRRTAAAGAAPPDTAGDENLRTRPGGLAARSGLSWMTGGADGEAGCAWIDDAAGMRLTLAAPPAAVPHLSIEADRGGFDAAAAEHARVCLEPATAPEAGPEGVLRSPGCRLEALQHHEWWLELSVGPA